MTATIDHLKNCPRIVAFSTTRGCADAADPYDGFSICDYSGDDPATVGRRREELSRRMGVDLSRLKIPRQTHSRNVKFVDAATPNSELDDVDALVTTSPRTPLCVNTADCVPLVIVDPDVPIVAAIHSGWRGTVGNIIGATIDLMVEHGAEPRRMRAAIGPAICADCFEVGPEVASQFEDRFVSRPLGGRPHVDLRAAVERQLLDKGVPSEQIENSSPCSKCNPELLFSARNLTVNSGRTATVAMIPGATTEPLIDEFVRYIASEKRLSPATVEAYSRDLKQWSDFATDGGDRPLCPDTTSTNDLRLWVNALAKAKVTQRSIRRKVQSLRAFFAFMMRRHALPANPAAELTLARLPKTLPVFARGEEVNALIDTPLTDADDFTQVRDRLIITMFYETGIRVSEMASLTDANINTQVGELKVRGKRNKDRIVPFGSELSNMIERYRQLRNQVATAEATPELLVGKTGKPMSRSSLYTVVNRELTRAGVHASRRSPHVLRHTFATDMLNNGADLSSVQQLLGHQSLATTQIYTHVTYRDLITNYQTAHPRATKKGEPHGS